MKDCPKIMLNDLLQLKDLENVKIRFNLMFGGNWNPVELFKNNDFETLITGHYSDSNSKNNFKTGQITIGLIRIDDRNDLWLLFHIGKITKELHKKNSIAYEYEELSEYKKYFGRMTVKYQNHSQKMIRNATSIINDCEIYEILPDIFDDDEFPGYDKVNLTWNDLKRVIEKDSWKTALKNQKGIYLITDTFTGKRYVGSAYGKHMILGRWKTYVQTGNGGNSELCKISFDYIKANFRYAILEIFKSTTDDKTIIERESWWKALLLTRDERFGYNKN